MPDSRRSHARTFQTLIYRATAVVLGDYIRFSLVELYRVGQPVRLQQCLQRSVSTNALAARLGVDIGLDVT